MKKITFILLIGLILPCCDKNELKVNLNAKDDLAISGTFETINSENITGLFVMTVLNQVLKNGLLILKI